MTEYLPTADSGHVVPVTFSAHFGCVSTHGQCTVQNHPNLIDPFASPTQPHIVGRGFSSGDSRVIMTPHCTYGVTGCYGGPYLTPPDLT